MKRGTSMKGKTMRDIVTCGQGFSSNEWTLRLKCGHRMTVRQDERPTGQAPCSACVFAANKRMRGRCSQKRADGRKCTQILLHGKWCPTHNPRTKDPKGYP